MRIEPLDEIESAIKPWFQVTMPLVLPSLCTFAFVIEDALEDMRCFVLMLLGALTLLPSAQAQNVTGYGSMPDPTLFLLREPAIHQALRLSDQQRRELIAFNDRYDEILLSTRNKPADEAQPKLIKSFRKRENMSLRRSTRHSNSVCGKSCIESAGSHLCCCLLRNQSWN